MPRKGRIGPLTFLKLWAYLMPDTELEARLTRQWGDIGFQGNDPASDFRGMGMQGLDDLVYYAKTYPEYFQRTFLSSQHPISWYESERKQHTPLFNLSLSLSSVLLRYPFAIVGINISQFTIQILRTRQLQHFLFKYGINRDTYQDLYCKQPLPPLIHIHLLICNTLLGFLYHSFNEYWSSHENPRLTVMEFEQTFKIFKQTIHGQILTQDLKPLSVLIQQRDHVKDSSLDAEDRNETLHQRAPQQCIDPSS